MDLDLPEEIWSLTFRYLDKKSLQDSELVCKKWLDIILNDVVLTGEYTLGASCLKSSTINTILAKRKKLKIFKCFRYYTFYHEEHSDDHVLEMIRIHDQELDLRFVDFKVCKDLTKVFVRRNFEEGIMPHSLDWITDMVYCSIHKVSHLVHLTGKMSLV